MALVKNLTRKKKIHGSMRFKLVYEDMEGRKVAYVRTQKETEEKRNKLECNVIELEAHEKKRRRMEKQ